MKQLRDSRLWSAVACLALGSVTFAGPGGSYSPSRGYGPTKKPGNYGGFQDHDNDHDHDRDYRKPGGYGVRPSGGAVIQVKPTPNTVITVQPGGYNPPGYNKPGYKPGSHFDGIADGYRPGYGPKPIVTIQPNYIKPGYGRPDYDVPGRNRPGYRPNNDRDDHHGHYHRPQYYNGGWYHGDWHGNWDKAAHRQPYAWGGWKSGNIRVSAVAVGSPWRYGYWGYSNPYYTHGQNVPAYINYSQPIIASTVSTDGSLYGYSQVNQDRAAQSFASARAAFFVGDYVAAQQQVEQALSLTPNDTVMHEFRALVLFASRQYRPASGAIYALLSSGPGWDWTTLIGLYPSVNVYTQQLRTLERFCLQNPQASEAHFLLAYHYLTAGHTDAAAEEYQQVLAVNPRDTLSAQLVTSLVGPAAGVPVAQIQPDRPVERVDPRFLIDNWTATREDGSTFNLTLEGNRTYRWRYFPQGGRPQEFSGTYTLSENVLVLKQNDEPTMVGQVTPLGNNRFNFRLSGSDQYDPGLNFKR